MIFVDLAVRSAILAKDGDERCNEVRQRMGNQLTQSDLAERLKPVFTGYNIKRAVLFGSYANGTADEMSDVDMLVDSGLRGFRFVSLCEDIRRTLGREVDLFDIAHIEKDSRIDREISETGVVIYVR